MPVDGVQHLNSCAPAIDDVVWITSDGADLWIIGTHGDPPPIDSSRLPTFETYFTDADTPGAPAAVTGLRGDAGFATITLAWDLPPEALWRSWEVYDGLAAGFAPAGAPLVVVTETVVNVKRETGSGPWYLKVRAINSRGEASAFAEVGPFALPQLSVVDLGPGSVHAEAMAAGAIDLASAVITGQLLEVNLADNAVTLAKVDATVTDVIDAAAAAASTADAKAVQAAVDAAAADGKANDAAAAAAAADAAAAAAAGIAASKAVVLYQATAPAAGYQNANTLWIDTTGGANTPKRWTGAAWAAVTDKAATDAASAAAAAAGAAATAQAAADAAQADADAAAGAAAAADGKATTALTTANGKNRIIFSTSAASGTAYSTGDVWFQKSGTLIIGQWEFVAGAWAARTLDNAVIGNLNAGKITAGFISADRIDAGTISAVKLNVADVQAAVVTATVVNALALNAGSITAGTLSVARLAAGSITANEINVASVQAAVVTAAKVNTLALSAGAITSGTMDADRIAAGTIQAVHCDVANLQASVVTAAKVNALALSADAITAGTLAVARLAAGSITTTYLNVANVQAGIVTAAAINALTINAIKITGGTVTGATLQTGTAGARVVITGASRDVKFYSGIAGEISPGFVECYSDSLNPGLASLMLTAPDFGWGTPGITVSGSGLIDLFPTHPTTPYVRFWGALRPMDKCASGTSPDGVWINDLTTAARRWKLYMNGSPPQLYARYGSGGSEYKVIGP